jgi:hypothetical protein
LHVLDVVNVFLGILHKLLNVDLLRDDNAADFIGEAFPARVLVTNNTFNQIGKGRLVLVVFEHTQSGQSGKLESVCLLVGVVHKVTNIEDETQDADETGRIPQTFRHA